MRKGVKSQVCLPQYCLQSHKSGLQIATTLCSGDLGVEPLYRTTMLKYYTGGEKSRKYREDRDDKDDKKGGKRKRSDKRKSRKIKKMKKSKKYMW